MSKMEKYQEAMEAAQEVEQQIRKSVESLKVPSSSVTAYHAVKDFRYELSQLIDAHIECLRIANPGRSFDGMSAVGGFAAEQLRVIRQTLLG